MKLNSALVCLDCETLMEPQHNECPSCGSRTLFRVSSWITTGRMVDEIQEVKTWRDIHQEALERMR